MSDGLADGGKPRPQRGHLLFEQQAAIALGKLGDKTVAERLQKLMTDGEPNLAKLSSIASALVVFNSLAIDVNLPFSGVFRLESGTVAASLKNLRSATAPYLDEPPAAPSEVSALYSED